MLLRRIMLKSAGIGLAIAAATSVGFAQQVLKREPPSITWGSVFLVDDGTCGKGKIIGGAGAFCNGGCPRISRRRFCIPRSEMKPS
jgi:hypothetical protein